MSELIVVGFKKDMYRASEALNQVKDLNKSWDLDLSDAVAVYRDYDGKLRVDQSYQMTTGQGAAWGGLFGGLIGALLAAPFTAGASVAGAAAAVIGAPRWARSMPEPGRKTTASPKNSWSAWARCSSPWTPPSLCWCATSIPTASPTHSAATAARCCARA